jgi:hypothetical protein
MNCFLGWMISIALKKRKGGFKRLSNLKKLKEIKFQHKFDPFDNEICYFLVSYAIHKAIIIFFERLSVM